MDIVHCPCSQTQSEFNKWARMGIHYCLSINSAEHVDFTEIKKRGTLHWCSTILQVNRKLQRIRIRNEYSTAVEPLESSMITNHHSKMCRKAFIYNFLQIITNASNFHFNIIIPIWFIIFPNWMIVDKQSVFHFLKWTRFYHAKWFISIVLSAFSDSLLSPWHFKSTCMCYVTKGSHEYKIGFDRKCVHNTHPNLCISLVSCRHIFQCFVFESEN